MDLTAQNEQLVWMGLGLLGVALLGMLTVCSRLVCLLAAESEVFKFIRRKFQKRSLQAASKQTRRKHTVSTGP